MSFRKNIPLCVMLLIIITLIITPSFGAKTYVGIASRGIINYPQEPNNSDNYQLHTEGRWIKNENGKTIFLKGVNRPSLEWRNEGAHWVEDDWDTIESWGCNVVRVPFTKEWWDTNDPTNDGMLYRDKIKQAINWGQERGIYTIIDMQWWTRTEQLLPMPPNVPDWIETWKEIAETYKDNSFVLFDLWNEPYGVSEEQWWSAAQDCVNAIRSTGSENLILVGVLNWSHDAKIVQHLGPITGENVVYSYHQYPHEFDDSNTVEGVKSRITSYGWKYILDNNIAPVIIGEFGAFPDEPLEIDFMKALGRIANGQENNDGTDWRMSYLAWWFIPYPDEHALIYEDWETPTNSGNALIDAINAIN